MAIDLLVWFFSIYPIDNVIPELHKRMKYMQIKQKHQQMLNICGNNGANATAKTIKKWPTIRSNDSSFSNQDQCYCFVV